MNVPFKKQFNYLLLLGIMLFSGASVFAQQGTIKGTVTDANGGAIVGATVLIEGTTKGTVSDIDGNFTIPNLSAGSVNLVVTSVGYLNETQTVTVTANLVSEVNIILIEDLQQLSEVVVVGYGVQKKSDLTGAVASVGAEDLQKIPNTGISSMLQGMAAGVMVLQNSGQPGSESSLRIRGLATVNGGKPLIVVDGISGGNLNDINPSDIESIEILKDAASQSIYGSAGGNGVILITTKKGKEGKLQVKFDMYTGVQTPWKKDINVADAQEYAALFNQSQEIAGLDDYFPQDANTGIYLNPETNEVLTNTNWTDEIFRAALVQNYNLSLSAGNKISKVFMGLNYNGEDGTVKRTSNDRYTIRLNSEHNLLKRFTVGENINFAQINYRSQDERNEYNSPLSTSIQMLPFVPVYATDGSGNFAYRDAGKSSNIKNPLAQIEYNNNINKTQAINGNAFVRADIIKGLTFESNLGMRYSPSEYRKYVPKHQIGSIGALSPSQGTTNFEYDYNVSTSNSWQWQNFFNYSFTIDQKNNFNLTAGYESGYSKYDYTNKVEHYDTIYFNPEEWEEFSETDTMAITQQKMTESTGYAYFARLNYDFNGILLVQANIRRDYSSKFGPNKRVGNFPSVSAGLKFSEFDFVRNLNIINFGKIRIGYGETGNSDIQPFQYLSSIASLTMDGYPFDGETSSSGAALITAGNPDLAWETVITKNIGADFRFLHNRLELSADVFARENKEMLLRKSIVDYAGYRVSDANNELGDALLDTRPLVNYGTLNNKGFEISVSYKDQAGSFKYEVNGNFTRAITTIEDIGDPLYRASGRGLSNVCQTKNEGPVSAFYGYQTNGIYQEEDFTWYKTAAGAWKRVAVDQNGTDTITGFDAAGNPLTLVTLDPLAQPGNFRFVDANGDGVISSLDMVQIGDPNPDFTFGFGFNLEYRSFDLSLFFQGSYGNDIYNMMKVNTHTINNGGLNLSNDLAESYVPATYDDSNPNSVPAVISPAQNTNTGIMRMDSRFVSSDFFVEDGSYLRLKNLQLGYTFPVSTLQKLKIQRLRIYMGARNLLTFTKYKGFDPEVNETTILEKGFDRGTYPQSRLYTIGLDFIF